MILVAFLVTKELGLITVSFSECLSVAATLSSLILSVIAMFYTYSSGQDTLNISNQIKNSVKEIDAKVLKISEEATANSEALANMKDTVLNVEIAILSVSQALDTLQQEQITEQDKEAVIENIKNTKSSMLMFLDKMKREN